MTLLFLNSGVPHHTQNSGTNVLIVSNTHSRILFHQKTFSARNKKINFPLVRIRTIIDTL